VKDPIKERVARAALSGAIAAIREEFPMHRVQIQPFSPSLERTIKVSHPTAMEGERFFRIKVSEPL
jgi:hypothetical protein